MKKANLLTLLHQLLMAIATIVLSGSLQAQPLHSYAIDSSLEIITNHYAWDDEEEDDEDDDDDDDIYELPEDDDDSDYEDDEDEY